MPWGNSVCVTTQSPGRIQKVDPPQGSVIYTIGVLGSRIGESTFWILPGVWEFVAKDSCAAEKNTLHGLTARARYLRHIEVSTMTASITPIVPKLPLRPLRSRPCATLIQLGPLLHVAALAGLPGSSLLAVHSWFPKADSMAAQNIQTKTRQLLFRRLVGSPWNPCTFSETGLPLKTLN